MDDSTDKINLKNIFTLDSLNEITHAGLNVISENPNFLSRNQGIRDIIKEVSIVLSDTDLGTPDLLPGLVRLILDRTAYHLEQVWPGNQTAGQHLLIQAVKQVMEALAEKPANGKWRPSLSKSQILAITSNLLDEVVTNPAWITDKIGDKTVLKVVLDSVFQALESVPKEERLNVDTVQLVLQKSIRATVTSRGVLNKIPFGTADQKRTILNKSLDLVFSYVFSKRKTKDKDGNEILIDTIPKSSRIKVLTEILDYVLDIIISKHPDAKGLILIQLILFKDPDVDFSVGFNKQLADQLIESSLRALAEHPDLVSKEEALQAIIKDVASALQGKGYKQPGLLLEIVRLIIESTAKNAALILDAKSNQPRYLLVVAMQQFLGLLAQKEDNEKWRPRLTPGQLTGIVESVLDHLVRHPDWLSNEVDQNSVFKDVLDAVFDALAKIPEGKRLSEGTLQKVIQVSLRVVATQQKVLDKIPFGKDNEKRSILNHALDIVYDYIFTQDVPAAQHAQMIVDLLDYVLDVVIAEHPDAKGLILVQLVLFKDPDVDFTGGFNRQLADQLIESALRTFAGHPDLLTKQKALQAIIKDVATALQGKGYTQPNLLLAIVQLILESTAKNADLVIGASSNQPRYLLVIAMQQFLGQLAKPDDDDKWRPRLSNINLTGMMESLLDAVVQHPTWLSNEVNEKSVFKDVLDAVFNALSKIPVGERLNEKTLQKVIQISLRVVVTQEKVLTEIPFGTGDEKLSVLNHALDIVYDYIFNLDSTPAQRTNLIVELLDYVLTVIIKENPNKNGLVLIQFIFFKDSPIDYTQGFNRELIQEIYHSGVSVLAEHPQLATNNKDLQSIVRDVAESLTKSNFNQPGLALEMVRLILESTARNANLIIEANTNSPKYLLVIAMQDILVPLSQKDTKGRWRPNLSGEQLLDLTEDLLDEVVNHPGWVTNKVVRTPMLKAVLDAVFLSLKNLPKDERLKLNTLEMIIQLSMRTALLSPQILEKVPIGDTTTTKYYLSQVLDIIINRIFDPRNPNNTDRAKLFVQILEYVMDSFVNKYPNANGLLMVQLILMKESGIKFEDGFQKEEVQLLVNATIKVVNQHPQLVTKKPILQDLLTGVTTVLGDPGINKMQLLPEVVRYLLEFSADRIELASTKIEENGQPKILLLIALEQTLRAITKKPEGEDWKPTLTDEQMLEITQLVLGEVIENPQWVGENKMILLTLNCLFDALEVLPDTAKLPYVTIKLMIDAGLKAVAFRKQLVIKFVDNNNQEQQLVLQYSMDSLLGTLYNKDNQAVGSWTLTQTPVLNAIVDAFLTGIAKGAVSKDAVDASVGKVEKAIDDLGKDLAFNLNGLLAELEG